ncbi:sperm flagellar protein 1 isoform X1 [Cuculus canorus]|uniref:sperm flagellar protein 1 isoform X1 n=1 Tax=Cuculus canorus TaxID=55661 RepID=UPI0023AB233E|nr:sperm flagellar protein 1 isoform X1 [Cuculus canorus]
MAEEARGGLYRWLDRVPLSRPRRNLTRDFSDGVLAAELVRFHFPALVQLHSFIPASATAQKLSNWGHLNRKVLPKLNFSIPEEVIQEIVQCRPGTVEQVLILLRQKIEEKQKEKRSKKAAGPGQEPSVRAALEDVSYLETGCSKPRIGGGCAVGSPGGVGRTTRPHGCAQAPPEDATIRQQLAEREQALVLAQETIQILQLHVKRLEKLLQLKNVRIDDLSRRLQEAQSQQQ